MDLVEEAQLVNAGAVTILIEAFHLEQSSAFELTARNR